MTGGAPAPFAEPLRVVRLLADGRDGEAARIAWTPASERAFVRYAAREQIAPWLLGRAAALLPPAVVEGLRAEADRRSDRRDRIPAALSEALVALGRAGVRTIVLKGLPFGARLYGDPRLRKSLDIDLLVRLADADRALRALWALGYRAKPRRLRATAEGPSIRRRRLRTEHALALHRDDLPIDLHWRLRTAPAYRIDEADLFRDAQKARVLGIDCETLSDEYALTLLLLSIASDIGRSGCRMKHLLDLLHLLRRLGPGFDWERFFARRARENVLPLCRAVLAVALAVFRAGAEFPALGPAAAEEEAERLVHRPRPHLANARWFLRHYPLSLPRDAIFWIDRKFVHWGSPFLWIYRGCAMLFRPLLRRAGVRRLGRPERHAG